MSHWRGWHCARRCGCLSNREEQRALSLLCVDICNALAPRKDSFSALPVLWVLSGSGKMFPPLVLWLPWMMAIEYELDYLQKLSVGTPPSCIFPHILLVGESKRNPQFSYFVPPIPSCISGCLHFYDNDKPPSSSATLWMLSVNQALCCVPHTLYLIWPSQLW